MNEKLSILYMLASTNWGGREQHAIDLAAAMKKRGHRVCIVNDGPLLSRFREEVDALWVPLRKGWADLFSVWILVKEILRRKVDIVHIHGGREKWLALAAIKLAGRGRLFVSRHTVLDVKSDGLHLWFHRQVSRIVCVSQCVRDEYLKKEAIRSFSDKVIVVYNGIDIARFHEPEPGTVNEFLKYKAKDELVIGYAGRVSSEKGVEYLVEALQKLRQCGHAYSLWIAGEGPADYRNMLEEKIKLWDLGKHVKFMGFLKDTAGFMQAIDVFALPCVWQEAFGLVLCEAMACGKPVVTTDLGAQREIVEDGKHGIIVETHSAASLVEAFERFINEPDLIGKMGNMGKESVNKRFTLEHMAGNMEKAYWEVLQVVENSK